MIIDTHTHLLMNKFNNDREEVIKRSQVSGVELFLEVGFDKESSIRAFEFAKSNDAVFAGVGIHPHDAKDLTEESLSKLMEISMHKKVVAWGETGLDYYRNLSPKKSQMVAFQKQIECSIEVGLPLIVHCRDAHRDMRRIIDSYIGNFRGVVHSFSGDINDADFYISKGFLLGIGGPITYKGNEKLKQVVRKVPLDRIILETDCPYLPPVPYRGKRNEPGYLTFVVKEIASIRQEDEDVIEDITTQAAKRLFKI
ncbi:TatD family hydrolase [bacterium]